ncbi:uncharacterized protein METZ01_LOCUS39892, partial [marine metagenome]
SKRWPTWWPSWRVRPAVIRLVPVLMYQAVEPNT